MYAGLTTNIPREIMGFSDFPFSPAMMGGSSIDSRRFPCSDEVRHMLGSQLLQDPWLRVYDACRCSLGSRLYVNFVELVQVAGVAYCCRGLTMGVAWRQKLSA